MLSLIFGRALQGIGGGGILPGAQAIMADAIAPRERGRYQAYMAVVWVTSGVGGPILGGVLSEHFHWSLIFWINLPLALAAAMMTYTRLEKLPRHERRHRLDILGAGLMMASAVLLLLALTWGGTRFPWLSAPIIALVAGSGVLSLTLAWWLARAPEPFLPLSVLAEPIMYTGTAANSFAMGAMNFFRALASAFAVAVMGAILLAGIGVTLARGGSAAVVAANVGSLGFDFAATFRWVFAAAEVFLVASLVTLILMEERPLRGPEQSAAGKPATPAG